MNALRHDFQSVMGRSRFQQARKRHDLGGSSREWISSEIQTSWRSGWLSCPKARLYTNKPHVPSAALVALVRHSRIRGVGRQSRSRGRGAVAVLFRSASPAIDQVDRRSQSLPEAFVSGSPLWDRKERIPDLASGVVQECVQ